MIGLYVHIPFCSGKCPYCDFYSIFADDKTKDNYTKAVIKEMEFRSAVNCCPEIKLKRNSDRLTKIELQHLPNHVEKVKLKSTSNFRADTLYIGGGTPTLLEGEQIAEIIDSARKFYKLKKTDEITIEANPCTITKQKLSELKKAGVNRISIGVQSGVESELRLIGRKHSVKMAAESIALAKEAGFFNISIDIILGIPGQTKGSLKKTLEFVKKADVNHCSFYQLKLEPNTPFGKHPPSVPDDDKTAEYYLFVVDELEKMGFKQYEISNFAKDHKQCKHNLKYWRMQEYLGFGAAAHSFSDGKRFYHERDISKYIDNVIDVKVDNNANPDFEWLMLKLRLNCGVTENELKQRELLTPGFENKIKKLEKSGLLSIKNSVISLTPKGMLVQNAILLNLYDKL